MRKSHAALPGTQRGATLIIALLILVMIMMYGIPAAMNSTQNERMAGNTRNRDLAFQAAESALKTADSFMNAETFLTLNPRFDPNADGNCSDHTNGFLCNGESHANDAAYWRDDGTANTFDWDTANNYRTPTSTLSEVAQQPRYVVEKMPDASYPGPPAVTKHYYRVTAMGVGKDSSAVVILQAMYEFP
jgi:type IV pilus assembly protein PilX